jgi:hypothetical protein
MTSKHPLPANDATSSRPDHAGVWPWARANCHRWLQRRLPNKARVVDSLTPWPVSGWPGVVVVDLSVENVRKERKKKKRSRVAALTERGPPENGGASLTSNFPLSPLWCLDRRIVTHGPEPPRRPREPRRRLLVPLARSGILITSCPSTSSATATWILHRS